jgi:hypothetical protein
MRSDVDYDALFKSKDLSPASLLAELSLLRQQKRFDRAELAISAYLRHRGAKAEPWMYEMLAAAMELNKREPSQVQTAIGWAGYLAERKKDPIALLRVADMLMLRQLDSIELPSQGGKPRVIEAGRLLDQATSLAPHLDGPIWLSMQLAKRHKDPERFARNLEQLLSLGWPGSDEALRVEAKRQTEAFAADLRSAGREADAQMLLDAWSQAASRDLVVRLTWEGEAAFELAVQEPLGATAEHGTPRTVFGGALVLEGRGRRKEALYTCPRGFDGPYTIEVRTLFNDEKSPVKTVTLSITTHEGTPQAREEARTLTLRDDRFERVTVTLEHGRRTQVLPYQAPPPEMPNPPGPSRAPAAAGFPAGARAPAPPDAAKTKPAKIKP